MDKYFLLIYTDIGYDGLRDSYHAWFQTKEELLAFEQGDLQTRTGACDRNTPLPDSEVRNLSYHQDSSHSASGSLLMI